MTKHAAHTKPQFVHELERRQMNVLIEDQMKNGRHVDDIIWRGPAHGSRIQSVGMFIIGSAHLIAALALALVILDQGGRLALVVPTAIAAFGSRIFYKSIVGRKSK